VLEAVACHVLDSVVARAVHLAIEDCWLEMAAELDVPANFAFDLLVGAIAATSRY